MNLELEIINSRVVVRITSRLASEKSSIAFGLASLTKIVIYTSLVSQILS